MVSFEKAKTRKSQHLVCGDSCLHSRNQEELFKIQVKGVHHSVSGPPMDTRRTLVIQKPTVSQKERLDESKKERQQQRFEVAYPLNGGIVRWNVTAA